MCDADTVWGLSHVMFSTQAKLVVEIGAYVGNGSTRIIADLLPPSGLLVSVDKFDWRPTEHGLPDASQFQLFCSNVVGFGIAGKVIPVRASSIEAARICNIVADVVYIDADHSEASVRSDIEAWLPHLRESGILCGDDYDWPNCHSVKRAVDGTLPELGWHVFVRGRFWWAVKKNPWPLPKGQTCET